MDKDYITAYEAWIALHSHDVLDACMHHHQRLKPVFPDNAGLGCKYLNLTFHVSTLQEEIGFVLEH